MPQCRAEMQCDVLCGDMVQSGPPAPSERKRVRSLAEILLCRGRGEQLLTRKSRAFVVQCLPVNKC